MNFFFQITLALIEYKVHHINDLCQYLNAFKNHKNGFRAKTLSTSQRNYPYLQLKFIACD